MLQEIPPRTAGQAGMREEHSPFPSRMTRPILQYIHAEQAGGIMLMLGGLAGILWANLAWESYEHVWHTELVVFFIKLSAHGWVNDGLMTLFFLLVGLEIKREMVIGELSSARQAALPIIAAIGGMAAPVAVFLLLNRGTESARGWGIPVATDIAFALGILMLLGRRVPIELKILLLALATVDDIGGIIIIAIFYADHVSWLFIGLALGAVVLIVLLRRLHVRASLVFGLLGAALWVLTLYSGVHPTIAGVGLGLLAPTRRYCDRKEFAEASSGLIGELEQAVEKNENERADLLLGRLEEMTRNTERPVERMERLLRPWVGYVVLPVFAVANTGVSLSPGLLKEAMYSQLGQGIFLGLLAGKFIGILTACWIGTKLGIAQLPTAVSWRHMAGVSLLAGVGFTVSLFIGELAFRQSPLLPVAQVAVLISSLVAGAAGAGLLFWRSVPPPPAEPEV